MNRKTRTSFNTSKLVIGVGYDKCTRFSIEKMELDSDPGALGKPPERHAGNNLPERLGLH
jgi:hypothetical protein